MIKKRVADLIDIEKDIRPYDVIAIYAGVGSGKNSFIEGYGHQLGLAEKSRVLLITSRRAKVDQTKKQDEETKNNFIQYIDTDNWDSNKSTAKSVVCTNAHIEKKIKETFKLGDESTYFWNDFDYIVIDEFHSLVTDVSFAESSFYLTALINFICNQPNKPKIILMSATPSPARFITTKIEPHILDLRAKAISLKPKHFHTLPKEYINQRIVECYKAKGKIVYFVTKLSHIKDTLKNLPKELQEKTAVVVSDNDFNKELKNNYLTIYNNGETIRANLSQKETIPDNIQLLITNSKLKEGINIKTPVEYLFIESHLLSDIQQMCGRIRNPESIKYAYLITDAEQFPACNKLIEKDYQFKYGLNAANKYLDETGLNDENRTLTIKYIESTTKYIRFNPFTNKFVKNILYKECLDYIDKELKLYDDEMDNLKEYQRFCDPEYENYFCENGTTIRIYRPLDDIVDIYEGVINSLKNLDNIDIFNYTFNSEDIEWLLQRINNIIHIYHPKQTPFKKLGNALSYINCKKEDSHYSHKKGIKPTFTIVKKENDKSEY